MSNLLTASTTQSMLSGLLLPVAFLVIFYFLLIRPQKKKEKLVKEMRSALKTGDKIVTIGGINGKVVKIKDDKVTIEVGDQTKIVLEKWAIANLQNVVLTKEESAK